MPFEERFTWVYAVIAAVVPAVYFAVVLPQLATMPASAIAYQRPMIIAIIASIVLSIIGAIGASIISAVAAEISGRGAENIEMKDERDVHIGRRGELAGYYVTSAGVVGVLILTMLQFAYFWIANGLYLTFVIAALVSSAVKLVAYRRGF